MTESKSIEQSILAGRITPGMTFNQKVWALTARIPRGRVTTYAELARALGTRAYRAVGNAMNQNPYAAGIPCHRVIASSRKLTGIGSGLVKRRKMLELEGVSCTGNRVTVKKMYEFNY